MAVDAARITQAGVTAAVAWSFTRMMLPGLLAASGHEALAAHTEAAESTPAFIATPAQ